MLFVSSAHENSSNGRFMSQQKTSNRHPEGVVRLQPAEARKSLTTTEGSDSLNALRNLASVIQILRFAQDDVHVF